MSIGFVIMPTYGLDVDFIKFCGIENILYLELMCLKEMIQFRFEDTASMCAGESI